MPWAPVLRAEVAALMAHIGDLATANAPKGGPLRGTGCTNFLYRPARQLKCYELHSAGFQSRDAYAGDWSGCARPWRRCGDVRRGYIAHQQALNTTVRRWRRLQRFRNKEVTDLGPKTNQIDRRAKRNTKPAIRDNGIIY